MKGTQPASGLSEEAVDRMTEIFANYPEIEQVVLYGSRAKGNYRPNSDIDLTIQGREVTWQQLQTIERQLDDLLLPYKIDLSLYHHIDNQALKDHIQRLGKVFYKPATGSQR